MLTVEEAIKLLYLWLCGEDISGAGVRAIEATLKHQAQQLQQQSRIVEVAREYMEADPYESRRKSALRDALQLQRQSRIVEAAREYMEADPYESKKKSALRDALYKGGCDHDNG
jgi:putative ubiquitin-RnfH superfamily antitoxin RatB of RatAB toxin-antitoxin module